MKRLFIFPAILVFAGIAFAQPGLDKLPTNDLIAWSGMPSPEPAPETQPTAAAEAATNDAVHTVTGAISKDGDSYVLKVSDTTSYQLDDQDKARQFAGQKVRVTGQVDLNNNQIHVQKIEPLV